MIAVKEILEPQQWTSKQVEKSVLAIWKPIYQANVCHKLTANHDRLEYESLLKHGSTFNTRQDKKQLSEYSDLFRIL